MRTQVDTTQRKNKSKQTTKIRNRPYAKRTHGYKMTSMITNKTSNERVVICHKSASDGGALVGALTMMCGRNEEP
jgi:hypothetical protein